MKTLISLALGMSFISALKAQVGPGPISGPLPSHQGGIVWFGTLRTGIAEARRTNRPILLISAAPHCHNVSGIW